MKIKVICPNADKCTIDCEHNIVHTRTKSCTQLGRCACKCIIIKRKNGK